jgi:hypothetical protein
MSTRDQATSKLEAIAQVRPDIAPVVGVALAVVKSAEADVAAANARAEAAEDLVKNVRPHLDKIERRAINAENQLRVRETIEKAATQREVDIERNRAAAKSDQAAIKEALDALGKSLDGLVPLIEVFASVGLQTRDQDGKSAIENRDPYAHFEIVDSSGRFVTMAETRKDAINIVKRMLTLERAAPVRLRPDNTPAVDDTDERKTGGRLDGKRLSKRQWVTKRRPRIL